MVKLDLERWARLGQAGSREDTQPTGCFSFPRVSTPGAVRRANTGHLALLVVPLTPRLRKIRTHLGSLVTSSGLSLLPKARRKVPEGALISLTQWSAPAPARDHLQNLVDMQIFLLSEV